MIILLPKYVSIYLLNKIYLIKHISKCYVFFFQKLLKQNDPSCDCFMAFNNRLLKLNKKAKHIHCLTFSAPHSSISFEDKNIYGGNQNRLNLFKTVATVRLG